MPPKVNSERVAYHSLETSYDHQSLDFTPSCWSIISSNTTPSQLLHVCWTNSTAPKMQARPTTVPPWPSTTESQPLLTHHNLRSPRLRQLLSCSWFMPAPCRVDCYFRVSSTVATPTPAHISSHRPPPHVSKHNLIQPPAHPSCRLCANASSPSKKRCLKHTESPASAICVRRSSSFFLFLHSVLGAL